MSSRKIDNPGVEINEYDRSGYGKVDYSLPNSPTCLAIGFADKGEDLAITWINSKDTLDSTYGTPTNEYESYFYNAAFEILNRGGTCIAAKLPYMNKAYNQYNYTEFSVSKLQDLVLSTSLSGEYNTFGQIHDTLSTYLVELYEGEYFDISTVQKMCDECSKNYEEQFPGKEYLIQKIYQLRDQLQELISSYVKFTKFAPLAFSDTSLTSYLEIRNKDISGFVDTSMEALDGCLTHSRPISKNTIRIYDMTRSQYSSLGSYDGCVSATTQSGDEQVVTKTNECIGIIPVLVTAPNALFFQHQLDFSHQQKDPQTYEVFNSLSGFRTLWNTAISTDFSGISDHVSTPIASVTENAAFDDGSNYDSLSRRAAMQFPLINFLNQSHFDKQYLKQIGVCVFKAFIDYDNNSKMGFQLLESFVGSFDKTAKDPITKANIFIDDVVNSRSQYIKLFSNVNAKDYERASTLLISQQEATSLGFYDVDCTKNIDYLSSIMKPLTYLFDNASNKNELPLDIVIDAGMSNIAQLTYVNSLSGGSSCINADEKPYVADIPWKFGTQDTNTSRWAAVLNKYDNFCKNQRKDCMFIADGLRAMCLDGNVKYIRKTSPDSTVANTIIPKFKYMTGVINSSYSAGYCNWYYQQDYSGDDYFWCPPSIKAAGVYIYCDTYFHPWSAPAGLTRGVLTDVIDVAFIPQEQDAGQIYSNQWNYAMSYPIEGIVIEGHKTFQVAKTALDRVNVRRLMLSLEKSVLRVARRFVYESNTAYLRQSFVDAIRPIFEDAVKGDGIIDYAIKCDEDLNTTEVIENNELRCRIALRPVKTVDYLVIDFICSKQSASVSEEVLR